MIRVLIVEDQRMAREDMENYIQSSGILSGGIYHKRSYGRNRMQTEQV